MGNLNTNLRETIFYIVLLCSIAGALHIFPFPVSSQNQADEIEKTCRHLLAIRCSSQEVDNIVDLLMLTTAHKS